MFQTSKDLINILYLILNDQNYFSVCNDIREKNYIRYSFFKFRESFVILEIHVIF